MESIDKTLARTGLIHIDFSVGSKEKVDKLTEQLRQDGYKVISGPRTTGDEYYESCIIQVSILRRLCKLLAFSVITLNEKAIAFLL